MTNKHATVSLALAGALATALASLTAPATAQAGDKDKCYGRERLRRRPGHHLRRNRQGRLSGQCLEARCQGHLHHDRHAARQRLAQADQAADLASKEIAEGAAFAGPIPSASPGGVVGAAILLLFWVHSCTNGVG
jgi:uncharacterized membrane protein